MRNRRSVISLVLVGFVSTCFPLFAHHGNASYDVEKTVTVRGVVTEYMWANPHVFVKVDAKDEGGNPVHWVIEAQNIVAQSDLGWSNVMFKPGDQVVIDVTPAKNGRPIGRFKGRIAINGQEFKPLR